MKFRLAEKNDFEALYLFYNAVIDQQKFDEYMPAWTKDVYPSKKDLLRHLQEDKVYLIEENDEIIASGIVSLKEDPIYKDGPWTKTFEDDEIAVLHLFAVHPKCRRRGLALDLLKHIIEETKKTFKAIHMDVVKGNKGAYDLYVKAGFVHVGDYEVYYEDTGRIVVDLMEYVNENHG